MCEFYAEKPYLNYLSFHVFRYFSCIMHSIYDLHQLFLVLVIPLMLEACLDLFQNLIGMEKNHGHSRGNFLHLLSIVDVYLL